MAQANEPLRLDAHRRLTLLDGRKALDAREEKRAEAPLLGDLRIRHR
jgi:hypothetical protein